MLNFSPNVLNNQTAKELYKKVYEYDKRIFELKALIKSLMVERTDTYNKIALIVNINNYELP